jgi:hypothetical protein
MLKKSILISALVVILLGWSFPAMAEESATDQAENIFLSMGAKTPGDIVWHCPVELYGPPNDSDNMILGCEYDGQYIYITGGGGTSHPDPNKVHIWQRVGGSCQWVCTVDQPTPTGWGWRDIAYDGTYLYASDDRALDAWTANCSGVSTYPAYTITLAAGQMTDIAVIRAVAYDEDHDWFWTADFSSNIYAFDRTGNMVSGPHPNNLDIYGMAYDNQCPGGPYLWVHVQDPLNVYQWSTGTQSYTGLVYSGWGAGVAGGLCVYDGIPSKQNSVVLLGVTQNAPDEIYALEVCEIPETWPNHKMHFPQLPDTIGWDVNATAPKILADDWQCSQTGWVTDIHFWGSWKDLDGNPYDDEPFTSTPNFVLSIHENIPASPDTPWSRPGRQVWGWEGGIPGRIFEPPSLEGWYDPNTDSSICNDHSHYWRYDFFVANTFPPADSFFQYEGQIYWLNITAVDIPPPYQWGWKNSRDHFMDDAVYADSPDGPWRPIVEPPRCNWFDVYFDGTGYPQDLGSTNYYGDGWYFYELYSWSNMWFYDNPFVYQPKHIWLEFFVELPYPHSYAEFAINWSTDIWSTEGVPGRPPLPEDGFEDLYIGRQIFPVYQGWNTIDYWITAYNPEWVSIDFRAVDAMINGWIYHECDSTSLDLAFVITGHEGIPPKPCGDVNCDGIVSLGDVVYLISYQYKGGPAPVPILCLGDVNNDDVVGLGDVVYLISFQYKGGPPPNPNCCNPPWK